MPLQPKRKTLRSCYTFAEESSCAFPNTRCDAQAPAQIFLLGKQASLAADAAPLEEEEEGSIHFTLYVSHPIASQPGGRGGRGEGTQLLERKRIHKKAAEPIPSHRTRYHRYQALRGRQKGREGAGTESPAALAACKACPMHAGTSWSCSPTYEKEGNMQMFRIKTLHGTRMR